ncbi:serine hydroxymethyltransferase [Priestia koreensis]|uniref:Serine hydroxymethyltransferase n=1 Tax=Priestia koreensis TaxID=284581 RepID=A0A0M0L8P3_9BACI|nr:serine hydroxymethyltransferase [Priestia koreensis]
MFLLDKEENPFIQKEAYFKEKSKERSKIEANNSEFKHRHGYDVATSTGLIVMEMQGAIAIFTLNLKRCES